MGSSTWNSARMVKHEEESGRVKSTSTTLLKNAPQFFDVIFDGKRMGIPKKFVSKYGENISDNNNTILLEVPTGETQWPVELVKDDDGKFRLFEKGWKEFCDHFSLSHGNFLVFRYKGNSTFYVIIFDTTASEIAYPHFDPSAATSDDASVEIMDSFSLQQEINDDNDDNAAADDDHVSVEFLGENYSLLSQDENNSARGRSRALKRAEAMQMSTKNPSSIVIMHPSYINPGNQISMKAEFVTKYFKQKRESVHLRVPDDGRAWTVKQFGYRLCGGWKKFVLDNDLEVGDVCVFETINGDYKSLKVIIFRAAED